MKTKFTLNAKLPGIFLLLLLNSFASAQITPTNTLDETNVEELRRLSIQFNMQWMQDSAEVERYVRENNVPKRVTTDEATVQMMKLVNGIPWYYTTTNLNAAISTQTDELWSGGSLGLSLDGSQISGLGVWDGGAVRTTHQEFNNTGSARVTQKDNPSSTSDHATHVAGTMVAGGVVSSAKGMSFDAELDAYDWNNDESEISTATSNGLIVSNHSYGYVHGWNGNTWYGNTSISTLEDYRFGFYSSATRDLDLIANNAPYYLMVKSAGNDRNDAGNGTYPPDGNQGAGYDCVGTKGTAKNILTIGSALDVSNYTGPSSVSLNSFSSTGPVDDGRIKPDIVANGNSLYSSSSSSNTAYVNKSGTSMSSPNTSGSLFLLQEHHKNTTGNFMRASTLKALVINTAEEAGTTDGPDYRFGWGLLNAKRAAEVITDANNGDALMNEEELTNGGQDTFHVVSNGTGPIVVTIVWNDPAHAALAAALDPSTLHLVNDLDLKVLSGSTTYYPYKLNRDNPTWAATNNSENNVDNVEQIVIQNPGTGTYVIQVDHDGTLASNQRYSLVVRGASNNSSTLNSPPVASFSSSQNCLTSNFTDGSSDPDGSIVGWLWNFGDGNSSSSQNPQHTYSSPGTYTVSLTVTDDSSATASSSSNISVTANTYYRDADGDGYGNISSTSIACSPPAGYVSVSGDCDDSNANVNPGAAEDCSNGIDDNCDQVIDEKSALVTEGFESGWGIWNDGGNDCSLSTTRAQSGVYSAKVRDNSGNASAFWSNNIDLSTYSSVTLDFWYYTTGFSSGEDWWLQISTDGGSSFTTFKDFNNNSDFSNNQWYHETLVIPSTSLSSTTRFKFISDASNNRDNVYIDDIEISACNGGSNPSNQDPTASFTSSENCLTVDFTDGSSDPDGSIVSWSWNFGDGNSSTAQNPQHTYASAGNYSVTLTVTDDSSATDVSSSSISLSVNTYYRDADGDGYGNVSLTATGCSAPIGYVSTSGDCDDTNANVNPGAAEDCTNGIDDNCNQDIDENTTIISDGFENGWGSWVDGGNDCSRSSRRASTGTYSINIQDNSGNNSSFRTNNLALSSFDEITIDFSFYAESMENGEDFWLQVSTDGGSTYTTVKDYNSGTEFSNGQWYNESVVVDQLTLSDQTRIKFVCDASNNKDDVYIDDIEISGCGATGSNSTNEALPDRLTGEDHPGNVLNELDLYPNPASNRIFVEFGNYESVSKIEIYDVSGQHISTAKLPTSDEMELDLVRFAEGIYLLRVEYDSGEIQSARFIKN